MIYKEEQEIRRLIDQLDNIYVKLTVPAEDSKGISRVREELDEIRDDLVRLANNSEYQDDDDDEEEEIEIPEPDPVVEQMLCSHNKVHAPFVYTSYPPKVPWICSECLAQGTDDGYMAHLENKYEYRVLLDKVIDKVKRGEK